MAAQEARLCPKKLVIGMFERSAVLADMQAKARKGRRQLEPSVKARLPAGF